MSTSPNYLGILLLNVYSMSLTSQVEAILFVASKPLAPAAMAKTLQVEVEAVRDALSTLTDRYADPDSGLTLVDTGAEVQLTTRAEHSEVVERYTTQEIMGELTRAQLETLTVVAYQGPITRPELETIRGVNCAIILRNLALRGLIEEDETTDKLMTAYRVSVTALRHLGIADVVDLPDYATLHQHPHLTPAAVDSVQLPEAE